MSESSLRDEQMTLPFPDVQGKLRDFYRMLGEYCLRDCKGDCCKRTYWSGLTEEEVEFMFGGQGGIERLRDKNLAERDGASLEVYAQCQVFDPKKGICRKHGDPGVPKFCREYPVLGIGADGITLDGKCRYVKNKLPEIERHFKGSICDKVESI